MAKPKAEPGEKPDPVIAELRRQYKELDAAYAQLADRLGDTRTQVRHLEKSNTALTEENAALHRALRNADVAKARAEGRAEALEAFTPEVMVPRNRFARAGGGQEIDLYRSASPGHWFEK